MSSASPSVAMRIAVIVPALDEQEILPTTLPRLAAWADQLIVSDGGSSDQTLAIAEAAGAEIVQGVPGRGHQLNRGAAVADADILLFVHADTYLPEDARSVLLDAIAGGAVGGGFSVRFDSERPIFRLGSWIVNLRTRLTQAPLGDQAQFVRCDIFRQMNGFRDWPILEDLNFVRRLRKHGQIAVLAPCVTTDARRFIGGGITRTIITNWLIWILYLLGVSPERLAKLYRHVR